ncbi:MAG: aspartate kinase [Bacteroidetes bacterium B1(2017)]|nr:MAG: aspartate kinase [Bacteroidetes bacterium B1(2017)]
MKVFKFGGASVKNAEAVRNVGEVLKGFSDTEVLVVVSAMGKTTNQLELLAKAYYEKNNSINDLYKELKKFHDDIIAGLLIKSDSHTYDDIENLFIELECELENTPDANFDKVYDQIVSYGEIFSSRILSAYLNESGIKNRWMDAQNFISTDNTYREGKVDWEITENLISKKLKPIVKKQMVVTQGFIGRNKDNFTVTLGREGSDYSAAIFAYGLDAENVTIWKDVAGVMNADPKKFPDAIKIDAISYPKAIEMAYYGATVIHPKTIQPLQSKNIPLFVKSFVDPSANGTIVGVSKDKEVHLPTIISKGNQVLISISSKDFSFIVEDNLSKIFNAFATSKIKINLMQNSAISFSVCVDNESEKISHLKAGLEKEYSIKINEDLELLTITNYTSEGLAQLLQNKKQLIEQKTRNTLQFVVGK